MSRVPRASRTLLLAFAPLGAAQPGRVVAPSAAADTLPRIVANDNRTPAGRDRAGAVVLQLVARTGTWHPEGADGPAAPMQAFAEEGAAPRIPGPLLRVRAGTVAEVTVRNTLPDTLRVFGLVDRVARPVTAADSAPLVVAPGARRSVRLRLDAAGTYLYWGATTGRSILFRTGLDAQLSGVIVVDAPGDDPRRARDRILVLGMWSDTVHRALTQRTRVLATVNGRAWPHTERFRHTVGDTVRWRIVNASADLHPMHLHGFYFDLLARGDGLRDERVGPPGSTGLASVTESVPTGGTIALRWVPERPGHWLAHCHVPDHFAARGPLGTIAAPDAARHADHARGGMGGMVVGIEVAARRGVPHARDDATRPRALRLLVRDALGGTDAVPLHAYALHAPGTPEPPPDSGITASPVLDLVRGEPVRITVVNRLRVPTAVHWHGIELDAYYDGVPGFSGVGRRTTPMIAPGDSFEVRFTPPRAGTFIYHTHADEVRQQAAGLAAALVVREPGTVRDPAIDVPLVFTSPPDLPSARRVVLVNARERPAPITMRVGTTYRLRFIQMSVPRVAMALELRRATAAPTDSLRIWRAVAKDGATLPAWAREVGPARRFLGVGETADVEVTPRETGELELQVRFGTGPTGRQVGPIVIAARVPVHVVAADAGGAPR